MFLIGQCGKADGRAGEAGKPPGAIVNMSSINARVAIPPGAVLRVEGRRRPAHQGDALSLAATASASTRSAPARS